MTRFYDRRNPETPSQALIRENEKLRRENQMMRNTLNQINTTASSSKTMMESAARIARQHYSRQVGEAMSNIESHFTCIIAIVEQTFRALK